MKVGSNAENLNDDIHTHVFITSESSKSDEAAVRRLWRLSRRYAMTDEADESERLGKIGRDLFHGLAFFTGRCRWQRFVFMIVMIVVAANHARRHLAQGHDFVEDTVKRKHAAADEKSTSQQERQDRPDHPDCSYDSTPHRRQIVTQVPFRIVPWPLELA